MALVYECNVDYGRGLRRTELLCLPIKKKSRCQIQLNLDELLGDVVLDVAGLSLESSFRKLWSLATRDRNASRTGTGVNHRS